MLPLQTSLKTKKKNLKCDLMILKAVLTSDETVLIPFWLQRKKIPACLELRASWYRPDALPAHVYCNVTKFNLLYLYNFSAVVMNFAHFHTPKIIPIYTQGFGNEFESLCDCFEAQNA